MVYVFLRLISDVTQVEPKLMLHGYKCVFNILLLRFMQIVE